MDTFTQTHPQMYIFKDICTLRDSRQPPPPQLHRYTAAPTGLLQKPRKQRGCNFTGFSLSVWVIFLCPVVPGSQPVISIPVVGTTPLASGCSWSSFQLWKTEVDPMPLRGGSCHEAGGSTLLLGQFHMSLLQCSQALRCKPWGRGKWRDPLLLCYPKGLHHHGCPGSEHRRVVQHTAEG